MRALFSFLLGIALCGTPIAAQIGDPRNALSGAIETCLGLSGLEADVTTALATSGWHPSTEERRKWAPLLTVFFHMEYSGASAESLKYAIENAAFMKASTLGNSPLPPDQPTYALGDLTLGVYGLSVQEPVCYLSGPAWIAPDLMEDPRFDWGTGAPEQLARYKDSDKQTVPQSESSSFTAYFSQMDMDEARIPHATTEIPESKHLDQMLKAGLPLIGDVAVTIVPKQGTP